MGGRSTRHAVNGIGAFFDGFARGQAIARGIRKDSQDIAADEGLAGVARDYTPTETQVASGEEALKNFQENWNPETGMTAQEYLMRNPETLSAIQGQKAGKTYAIGAGEGFQRRAEPFSAGEISGAKAGARADIYANAGREEDAARVLMNESRRRTLADDAELRAVMGGLSSASQAGPSVALDVVRTQGLGEPIERGHDRNAADAYYARKAPEIVNTYLRQGKLTEARAYRDFVESDKGRAYAEKWSRGVRKFSIGDHQGALGDWEGLYNEQVFDDGNTVKLTPHEDGKQVRADFFDKAGSKIRSFTQPIDALARQAGMALAPEKLVEMRAKMEAQRETEGATLGRSLQLEGMRQQGQETREDRRDARLKSQLDAQAAALDKRLEHGGLTAAQQRGNAEIDAARQMVAGLSDDEIRQRTTSTMASGRENPLFDGRLAAAVKLAGRRRIGDDPDFDQRAGRQAGDQPKQAGAFDRADIAKRFRADATMNSRTLGKETPNGIEVMEKGKLIGYFR